VRNFGILVVAIVLLLLGGGLTAQLANGDITQVLPIIRQTNVGEASFIDPAPWQAQQFVIMVSFILFNLIGIAATLALVMWLLDRQVRQAKATRKEGAITPAAAAKETARAE
jgi:nitrate/nitrite transporter NarK